jgi:hypothetical protein
VETPLPRPDHLRDVPTSTTEWLARRPFGIAALVAGLASFAVCAMTTTPLWSSPDWRISVPGFVLAVLAAVASAIRRERAWGLWLLGVGLAAAALVLGWFLLVAVVIGATALVMLIVHTVM